MSETPSYPSWARPHPTPRLKGSEVRERVLSAAEKLLEQTGLTVGLDHLNMEELIRHVGVPRTSVFKEFGGKESLVTALTIRMIQPEESIGAAFSPETIKAANLVLYANGHRMGTQEGRDAVLREAVRVGALRNYQDVLTSPSWKTYMALSVSLPGLEPSRRNAILEALQTVEVRFIQRMAEFYASLLKPFNRKVRSGCSLEQIAAAGSAVVEGLAQRHMLNPEIVDTPLMLSGLNGDLVEWHLAALGFWAVVDGMTEVDSPDN
ncbi:TetR family transcriptional regulator [Rathayibacter sp. VKM Ac-2804]|uniref:TetR/AcrR family transcriptional regulator n=1 Tax=Rathayibacter sp. VKM Ac-2804 TaxID=2609257 RepID=UPI00132F1150|nr:TetR family transcriptional regulator [Rathayibacter sp. VKM Ac-2804]QHF22813.1 TetR family transcriptional regulator [Rathayibacter sp. VKM Ac-2804]